MWKYLPSKNRCNNFIHFRESKSKRVGFVRGFFQRIFQNGGDIHVLAIEAIYNTLCLCTYCLGGGLCRERTEYANMQICQILFMPRDEPTDVLKETSEPREKFERNTQSEWVSKLV